MECIHSKFVNAKNNKFAICAKCGTLLKLNIDSVTQVIKEGSPNYNDLSLFDIFNNMKKQAESFKINKLNEKYVHSRRELIDYMKHLNNKFQFSDITLYLGIYLMDIIGSNNEIVEYNNLELISISCLILSCNIILIKRNILIMILLFHNII